MIMTPEMGIIENGAHTLPVRVYFEDTDTGGVVYYANYLKYAERARTEMLRCIGFPHSILIKKYGINFVVRHCEADYFASSYLDDELIISSGKIVIEPASLRVEQKIMTRTIQIAKLLVKLVSVNKQGKPTRLPKSFCDALSPLLDVRIS
ncbi:MAG: hypothetical protein CMM37_04250 [Rhodospirillaceae bacterium]|nr:hypothetical protein [Rhodospirillaceae bacterium]